jgi:hypothetical protein
MNKPHINIGQFGRVGIRPLAAAALFSSESFGAHHAEPGTGINAKVSLNPEYRRILFENAMTEVLGLNNEIQKNLE